MDLFEIGGEKWRVVKRSTFEHDIWVMKHVLEAGLDEVRIRPDEKQSEFALRLLREVIGTGKLFVLLGGMLLPEGVPDEQWSPERAEQTVAFMRGLSSEEDKEALLTAVARLLVLPFWIELGQSPDTGATSTADGEREKRAVEKVESLRPIGVAFGGGGFKGASHAGSLSAFRERGVPIDVVCGVSVGALTAALVAQEEPSLLDQLWDWIDETGPRAIFQRWPFYKLLFKPSLYSNKPLKDLIGRYVKPDKIRASSIRFFCGATCLQDGQLRFFDNAFERITDALLASCSVPGFFEPVTIDGKQYVDGGVVCNLPAQKLVEEGCQTIFILSANPRELRGVGTQGRFGVVKRALEILMHSRDKADVLVADLLTEKINSARGH